MTHATYVGLVGRNLWSGRCMCGWTGPQHGPFRVAAHALARIDIAEHEGKDE